jgi:hypothetical protein
MKITLLPYLCDDPEARNGWAESKMSGDVAYMDDKGHLHFVDREAARAVKMMLNEIGELKLRLALGPSIPAQQDDLTVNRFIVYGRELKKILGG